MQSSATTARTSEGAVAPPPPRRLKWPRRLLLAHLELQDWLCRYCRVRMKPNGRLSERPTLEHLEATSALGRLSFENTAASCHGCNQDKGHLSDAEYRAVLAVRRRAAGTAGVEQQL